MVALLQHSIPTAVLVSDPDSLPNHHAITPAKDAEGVWIDGVPHLITSELKTWSTLSNVESISIPGYWFGKKGTSHVPTSPVQPGENVFIFFHGGGYTVGCAHPATDVLANIPRVLIELSSDVPRGLSVEYRLSSTYPLPDRHPFPAALLDALAGYNYLAGTLALALVRYLTENGSTTEVSLPGPPGGLLLLSPWTDLSDSHDTPGSSSLTNTMDIIGDMSFVFYCKRALLGPHGLEMASYNRYVSPASLHPSVQARLQASHGHSSPQAGQRGSSIRYAP
ncbi:hypothetical protein EDC04DRAFT_2886749 [Pisolithus marmoratus]|nr:hypothetical protein EDC04DRAFT_2886749 [Pisolithus marmoratus]